MGHDIGTFWHKIYFDWDLPNQQSIVIDDLNDDTAVSAALTRTSTLLAFFELNERDHSAR